MKRLYRAANLPEAHLLMHLLQQSGIGSHVLNENAQSGAGQLPITEAYPEVWIERESDLQKAQLVVSRYETRAPDTGAERACSHCGQLNPSTFELCWNCAEGL